MGESQRMTETEVFQHFSHHELFEARVREVALTLAKLQKITYYDPAESLTHEVEYDYPAGTITAHWDESYRGDTSHETITFPIDYLWMEDFLPVATARWEAERQAAREAAEAQEKAKALRIEQDKVKTEKVLYAYLHEKYGTESN